MEVCRTYCTGKIVVLEQLAELADHPSSLQSSLLSSLHWPNPTGDAMSGHLSKLRNQTVFATYYCRAAAGWNQRLLSSNRTDITAH